MIEEDLRIPKHRISGCAHDNAANMVGGLQLTAYDYDVGCFNHTTQLSVNDGAYGREQFHPGGVKGVVDLLKKAADTTSYLRRSTKAL